MVPGKIVSHDLLSKGPFLALLLALGLGLAFLPLDLIGLLVLGGVFFLAVLVRPHYGLYLLVWAVPFGSLREIRLGHLTVGAMEATVGLTLMAWLVKMVAERRMRISYPPLLLPLLLFLGALFLSLTQALSLQYALKEILKWLEVVGIYVFVVQVLDRRKAALLAALMMLAGLAEALLGLYQFLFRVGPAGFLLGRFMRAYGTFQQPNPYGGYLGLVLPVAYALLISGCGGALWGIALGGTVLMGAALVASWSRGAWMGFASAFLAVNLARGRRWAALCALAAVVIILMGGFKLLPSAVTERFADLPLYLRITDIRSMEITEANYAVLERLAHWQAAWRMFEDHPWLGVGIGNYEPVYPAYALPQWPNPMGHAHNYYLNILAETGLVGLASYLILWMAVFRRIWRALCLAPHGTLERALALGILGVITHLCVHNLVDNLYVHGMYLHLAILLGMMELSSR